MLLIWKVCGRLLKIPKEVNGADADKNGTLDLQELEEYASTYGLVANLNASPVAR
ncbi:MAG: hypothetical protein KME22_02295 [Hassallia sp. WJT32-NPBG1]|nr:hypothetical protein [Hassallia sp. WJT32-NPBG1]